MFRFKDKKLIFFLSFISIILLVCFFIPILTKPTLEILRYPLKIFNSIGKEFKAVILYHHHFIENKKLSKEVEHLKQWLIQAQELYLENLRLQKILYFKHRSSYNLVAAKVIGRDPSYWTSVIIVDKGKRDNIKQNQAVINYAGLVGKVIEAGDSVSKAMLLNDPNLGVSAIVQRTRQEGLVSGTLENQLIMRYLPPESDIKPGDVVLTSGLTGLFPKGIFIGTVVEIGKEFSGLSLYCLVKPAVDFAKLEEVLVLIK